MHSTQGTGVAHTFGVASSARGVQHIEEVSGIQWHAGHWLCIAYKLPPLHVDVLRQSGRDWGSLKEAGENSRFRSQAQIVSRAQLVE